MNRPGTFLLIGMTSLFSGCSYLGSFLVCNISGSPITVSYRLKEGQSYEYLFSNSPEVLHVIVKDEEAQLGAVITGIPWKAEQGITITIPSGAALQTGEDVNAWSHGDRPYKALEQLMVVQGADTSLFTGVVLASVARDLGGQNKGLIIR